VGQAPAGDAPQVRDAGVLLPPLPGKPDRGTRRSRWLPVSARAGGVGRLRLRRRGRAMGEPGAAAPGGALRLLHAPRVASWCLALAAACDGAVALRARLVRLSRREGRCRVDTSAGAGVVTWICCSRTRTF